MCKQYNGWENYPTWNVMLWIDNSQGDQEFWQEVAETLLNDNDRNITAARPELERVLKGAYDDQTDELFKGDYGPLSDILSWALDIIDWREIADSILTDTLDNMEPLDEEEEEEGEEDA